MCIIVAKTKNVKELPRDEYLRNCFDNNPDGMGFMYTDHGQVIIDKGYMTYDKFKTRYDELCKKYHNFKNKALVMHFRIGTSSANTPQNTHPYPIETKEKRLHKTYYETDLGVVHNGIIHDYTPKDRNATMNDTQHFIQKYLAPLYKHYKEFYKNKYIMDGIGEITNSRILFLDSNDEIYKVGDYVYKDNIIYSNDTFDFSWYNKFSYDDTVLGTNEYLPKDATVMLSDGTEVDVGDMKLQIDYVGNLYEIIDGRKSLIDTDCYCYNDYGYYIYNDMEDYDDREDCIG